MQQELDRLAKLFLRFPGIGERQAKRFAYFVLTQPASYVETLARALTSARNHAHTCTRCFRIYEGDIGMCSICTDQNRDQSVLVVVEKSQDIDSFERTEYTGLFFVLSGLIPIVQKNIVEGTNAQHLMHRVKNDYEQGVLKEIIMAFPLTPNGEHTDSALRELLAPYHDSGLTITSLGRGLSSGAELEYADATSLNASLKKRE